MEMFKHYLGFKKHTQMTIQAEIITFSFQSFIIKNYWGTV